MLRCSASHLHWEGLPNAKGSKVCSVLITGCITFSSPPHLIKYSPGQGFSFADQEHHTGCCLTPQLYLRAHHVEFTHIMVTGSRCITSLLSTKALISEQQVLRATKMHLPPNHDCHKPSMLTAATADREATVAASTALASPALLLTSYRANLLPSASPNSSEQLLLSLECPRPPSTTKSCTSPDRHWLHGKKWNHIHKPASTVCD